MSKDETPNIGDVMTNPQTGESISLTSGPHSVMETRHFYADCCGAMESQVQDEYDGEDNWISSECTVCGAKNPVIRLAIIKHGPDNPSPECIDVVRGFGKTGNWTAKDGDK